MATVLTGIVTPALQHLEQVPSGGTPSTEEQADALIYLNQLLDSWRNERLMCYAIQDQSISLTTGQTTRTMGPTGNLVTTRPVEIQAAYVVVSNQSYDVAILNENEYAAIPDKTATAPWPSKIYYQPSMPDGTVYMHPVTSGSSTLHVLTRTPVLAFAAIGDTVTLPPGWERALAFNLALEMAGSFGKQPSDFVVAAARQSKMMIKRANTRPLKLYTELPYLVGQYRHNILTDR